MPLLEVSELSVIFDTQRGPLRAVDHISFSMEQGETLGIVGESGSGKSVTSLALMGLLPPQAKIEQKKVSFNGVSLFALSEKERRRVRGKEMAMVFQDPMTSLNPCFTVEFQIGEVLRFHKGMKGSKERRRETIKVLERVGIADPESRLPSFSHELSGGMAQRVMIAMAIASDPKLLIADEPTTALDVTIQALILELLRDLQRSYGMGLILITHDLGIVAEMAKRLAVMYAGQMVETGETKQVLLQPAHPYTESLLQCLPSRNAGIKDKLPTIPGMVPDLVNRPTGCQLNPRCKYTDGTCRSFEPETFTIGERLVKCFRPLMPAGGVA